LGRAGGIPPLTHSRLCIKREVEVKSRTIIGTVLACLVLAIIASVQTATAQGQSPSSPAPVGAAIKAEVYCGESAGSLEPYDANITLVQAVRGKEALEQIKAASTSNKPPKAGFEYVLARVKFEMKARGAPGNKTFELGRTMQFTAMSPDGREYEAASVTLPKPELSRTVRAGESAEGWVAFLVEQKESKPVMVFDPASGGAMGRGKILFFQLY